MIKTPTETVPPIKNIYEHGKEDYTDMGDNFLERKGSTAVQTDENKELAAIKSKMFLAREFPRNIDATVTKILTACGNIKLAEKAIYSYPKGGQEVTGPSIRLAEAVAQNWGNFLCGVKELERFSNKAIVSSYAWDLETNFQDEKVFEVPFVRNTKNGSYALTDERDKYEMIANQAARRKRACILAVIPQWIFDMAMEACEKTLTSALKNQTETTIEETRANMLAAFKEYGEWITEETLAGLFGKNFDAINNRDIVKLRNLYNSIRDGFVKADVAFGRVKEGSEQPSIEETEQLGDLAEKVKANANKKTKAKETQDNGETVGTDKG